jgi:diketogulonate reductase-like aldo/keto reductase
VLRQAKIVSNQVRYSLIERTIETRLLAHCQQEGVTIMAYSPLGHSFAQVLANDNHRTMESIARETGKTQAQVALNWCVRHRGVVAIPKTESPTHLAENCASSGWRMTDNHINRLNREVRFRRRSELESALRRIARNTLQRCGRA